jgi:5'-3' exonuclease
MEIAMKALLDTDIFVYRVGFTTEEEDFGIAAWRMSDLIERTLDATKATSFQCYLTASKDETAFRRKVYPEYKMNRKAPRPKHYEALREFLVREWSAKTVSCIEADDAIGIDSREGNCVIVSIDKDLKQLSGLHYNFVKEEFQTVTEEDGTRFFYTQCLTGDVADNVKGIAGIGPKKAEKLLMAGETEDDWFNIVRETYDNDYEFFINGTALWILKEPLPNGAWKSHRLGSQLQQQEDSQLLSLQSLPPGISEQLTSPNLLVGPL